MRRSRLATATHTRRLHPLGRHGVVAVNDLAGEWRGGDDGVCGGCRRGSGRVGAEERVNMGFLAAGALGAVAVEEEWRDGEGVGRLVGESELHGRLHGRVREGLFLGLVVG